MATSSRRRAPRERYFLRRLRTSARPGAASLDRRCGSPCAQPGDQISIFGDALRELSERAAYLYRESDRYWFSTQPTLNRIADERAKDVSTDDADAEITAILRKDQGSRGGLHRVHGAPDNPLDVEDALDPSHSLSCHPPAAIRGALMRSTRTTPISPLACATSAWAIRNSARSARPNWKRYAAR